MEMRLHYERTGEGRPLVLLHGLGGSNGVWRPVVEILARARDVIVPDLPGFGGSDTLAPGVPATAANLGVPVEDLCRGLGVGDPDLAGNSLGAWVCLEMAKRGRARSVTAISPAGLWRDALGPRRFDARRLGRGLRPLVDAALRTRRGRRALLQTTVADPSRLPPEDARAMVMSWLDAPGYEDANEAMRAEPFEHEGRVDVPVTIAWGEQDRLLRPPRPERMPPGARFLAVPGWGHTPTWDDPAGVARLILETCSAR